MVNVSSSYTSNPMEENKNLTATGRGGDGGGGATRSWSPTVSGQSMSTRGSIDSPSSRSDATAAATVGDNTFIVLNNLDVQGDDAGSQGTPGTRRMKRGQRSAGGDKNGRGLRQFSMKAPQLSYTMIITL